MLLRRSLLRPPRPQEAAGVVARPCTASSARDHLHVKRSSAGVPRSSLGRHASQACSSSSSAQLSARTRRSVQSTQRHSLIVRADASARVKGDVKRVFLFLTDVTSWTAWYPGVQSATRTLLKAGGCNQDVGTRFVLEQKLAGFKVLTTYEVAQSEDYKRIVYTGRSKLHTVTDQFVFMADPNDPSFTIVRYQTILDAVAGNWQSAALKPLIKGLVSKVPDEAMDRLRALLGSSSSPLGSIKIPGKEQARARAAASSASKGSPKGGSSKASSSSSSAGASSSGNIFQALGSMFGGFKSASAESASPSSSSSSSSSSSKASSSGRKAAGGGSKKESSSSASASADALAELDPRRYYQSLGLDPRQRAELEAAEVRAAFRKLAQTMHPDKSPGADEKTKAALEIKFRVVQEAYEVLKDPDTKKAYDEGRLTENSSVTSSSSRA